MCYQVWTSLENRQPMVITRNGEASAVILDADSYQQQQELLALLKILATGQQQIEQGDTEPDGAFFNRLKQQMSLASFN
ncbi:type II toxin-antitoxin system prevent-host-death family antitoxin [Endozoicomonas sp. 4G]|uniref:type II toxin-antitoxin system prevent-host-death family antitoxin n=1 Tax=Endozoicomonas sp. 4G TaxID=2872754 RepID=UPI00207862B8|nr:type II toxin-antitoxin system prevent-host-death family antitoxin [Endozoicomonas sp. 4G]